jgi:hypothetical protein
VVEFVARLPNLFRGHGVVRFEQGERADEDGPHDRDYTALVERPGWLATGTRMEVTRRARD